MADVKEWYEVFEMIGEKQREVVAARSAVEAIKKTVRGDAPSYKKMDTIEMILEIYDFYSKAEEAEENGD